ncbi:MAG: hypothetical protein J6V44_14985 [Methanobrevibacter sp.]|nr:hypothetical protein [Methanobrevibacter sp.]MBO7692757.1 hypothetical protein [Methanobrevibacter sp.]
MILKEDRQLYRGIFWITDIDDLYNSKLYFQIPCDENGDISDIDFTISDKMSSTGSNNYNHKRVWNSLSHKETKGKPFDYYPRGRVEISNGIAKVYHSPYIDQNKLKSWVTDRFNLTSANGIKKVKMIADGSNHYRCYLDENF